MSASVCLSVALVAALGMVVLQRRSIKGLKQFDPYVARNFLQHYESTLQKYHISARVVYERGYWNFTARWGEWYNHVSLSGTTIAELHRVVDAWITGLNRQGSLLKHIENAEKEEF